MYKNLKQICVNMVDVDERKVSETFTLLLGCHEIFVLHSVEDQF